MKTTVISNVPVYPRKCNEMNSLEDYKAVYVYIGIPESKELSKLKRQFDQHGFTNSR